MALTFFAAVLPNAYSFEYGPGKFVWVAGAVVMGVISLVRFPPRAVNMTGKAFLSTAAALVFPVLVRPTPVSAGIAASIAPVIVVCGLMLSLVARLYMGRSFGILPGNRGIVTGGPFRVVRHPIYSGWLLLATGYLLSHWSWINFLIVSTALPFMLWRILLEEQLLLDDPEYREYVQGVHFRLIPGVI